MINDLTAIFTKPINDEQVNSGSKAVMDITSGFAFFLRVTSGGAVPNVSIQLQSILNENGFKELAKKRNESFPNDLSLFNSLLNSVLQLPSLVGYFEHPTILKSIILLFIYFYYLCIGDSRKSSEFFSAQHL